MLPSILCHTSSGHSRALARLPLYVAGWLLDSPVLGQFLLARRVAGHLLKRPARAGIVPAQSRLGLLLCQDCKGRRDRRIGWHLLQQAARAGDRRALRALGHLPVQPRRPR